ncbi:hypothetical protein [Acinetobacter baumannii]|uniref:hypothetical protein n=1 Tax=Acinetobacter baumannii TaxID=470 RepID=UPI001D0EFD90|nr:hypothetical protein [Acinetobacter baumannii]
MTNNDQVLKFKNWFASKHPESTWYFELANFDFQQEIFTANDKWSPDSGIAAKVLSTSFTSWSHCQKEIQGLRMLLWFVKDHFDMNGLDKAMPRVYEKLKGATTDIIKPNHNTSCTYQFELAFHNLQDTPELRKIYWSALGQLHFDSNDQVITPELEECACCNANIRKIGTETEGYETYDIGVDESGSRYIRYRHGKWELEQ